MGTCLTKPLTFRKTPATTSPPPSQEKSFIVLSRPKASRTAPPRLPPRLPTPLYVADDVSSCEFEYAPSQRQPDVPYIQMARMLAQIPDDPKEGKGIEAALLKLEGRYEKTGSEKGYKEWRRSNAVGCYRCEG